MSNLPGNVRKHAALIACVLTIVAATAAAQESRPRKYSRTTPLQRAAAARPSQAVRRYVSQPSEVVDAISSSEAQWLVNAPIARNYLPRNYGPTDVGGKGTATGEGIPQVPSDLAVITTLYGGVGAFGGGRGGWGAGYPGFASPVGIRYPGRFVPWGGSPWAYGWGSGPYLGYSVYNPNSFFGNSYYGGYGAPGWTGYGGFGFPNSFGAFSSFGYPYAYGVYGYPYYNYMRPTHAYLPSYAYFMYPGVGGLYVPPGYFGFPGYYGYGGYGRPLGNYGYGGGFYW